MTETSLYKRFEKTACDMGAVKAKVIDANTIVVAPWVLFKCRYGCGDYNSNLCCPPNTPTPKETEELIKCFNKALLFQCKQDLKPGKILFNIEREIFLAGFYKAIGLGSGACRVCGECNNDKCIKPEIARPSMEACGIDVFATVRSNGFSIDVLKDGEAEGNWYGLVLIE